MTSLLSQLCTEYVYRNNAFHILGIPTTASSRIIRRRQEDFESAHALGATSWAQEFPQWMPKGNVPSYEEVCEAFAFITDPANRTVSEFFWIWPIDGAEKGMNECMSGVYTSAIKSYLPLTRKGSNLRPLAQHNLAVIYHALAIEGELAMLAGDQKPARRSETLRYWESAFSYWEKLADDDDFWALYEARMREFDDPRLTGGFIRRFRQEFPIAFDNINARIALSYARKGLSQDAQRHVVYMKKTMSGLDDVEASFDALFEPLENQIERVIAGAKDRVSKQAEVGAECVQEILTASADITRAANDLLGVSNQRRQRILTNIFTTCNQLLVAYGNKTEKWKVCLDLSEQLVPLACTEELKERITANIDAIKRNLEEELSKTVCANCGAHKGDKRPNGRTVRITMQPVKLWGNVRRSTRSFGEVVYSTREIEIPCCDKCRLLNPWKLGKIKAIIEAKNQGFHIGNSPPQHVIRELWGFPEPKKIEDAQVFQFLVKLAIIAIFLLIGVIGSCSG